MRRPPSCASASANTLPQARPPHAIICARNSMRLPGRSARGADASTDRQPRIGLRHDCGREHPLRSQRFGRTRQPRSDTSCRRSCQYSQLEDLTAPCQQVEIEAGHGQVIICPIGHGETHSVVQADDLPEQAAGLQSPPWMRLFPTGPSNIFSIAGSALSEISPPTHGRPGQPTRTLPIRRRSLRRPQGEVRRSRHPRR